MVLTGAKLIAVGDSITYASVDPTVTANGAWRYHLAGPLAAFYKSPIIWKGTMQALGKEIAGERMLGTSGRRIDQVISTDNAAQAFSLTFADMAIIHLGTNDMTQLNSGVWAFSVATSIANMSTLLDHFRSASPLGLVVVCKIMPNRTAGADTLIDEWNTALSVMVAARSDAAYIMISDVNAAFKANASWSVDYMFDDTHPNDTGEALIASTIMDTISANVTQPIRMPGLARRQIKPHTGGLRYPSGATATDLGADVMLDSTMAFAVSMDIDLSRNPGSPSSANGILCLKTDQATPFVFLTLPTVGGGGRGIEFGSSANFSRFFPQNNVEKNVYQKVNKGWHQILVTFDGVNRTALGAYKLYVDGINVTLASGAGLGATANVNQIARVIAGGSAGIFSMADLTIWNGGSLMTAQQVFKWYTSHLLPSGPTLTHHWDHSDQSGLTLTDSVGTAHGTIGTGVWDNANLPTISRAGASARTDATARALAS